MYFKMIYQLPQDCGVKWDVSGHEMERL